MDRELRLLIEKEIDDIIVLMPSGTGMMETAGGERLFLKTGARSGMYRCESHGLAELLKADGVNIPRVLLCGDNFIVTEYIAQFPATDGFYGNLGRMVASLHRFPGDEFGFYEDNFIGGTPQQNIPLGNEGTRWADFYFRRRLVPQLELAGQNGYGRDFTADRTARLESAVYAMLPESGEKPSLLHGDLWGGNYICGKGGRAYLIDPAVYYGDREADIAMTLLFGGFPQEFYRSYNRVYPLRGEWQQRMPLYQLYHILNHLNLFGTGYLKQALNIIDRL